MEDEDDPGPGYLWRPGSSVQDNPLLVTVALVVTLIVVGAVVLAVVSS